MSTERLPEHVRVAIEAGECLEAHGIAHMVCGSVASSIHGEPRSTYDIDMVVDVDSANAAGLVAALAGEFILDPAAVDFAIETTSSCNALHRETAIKLDLFVLKSRPFSREEFARRQRTLAQHDPDRFLRVASPEDMVLTKLEWFRKGGEVSERQWRDVLGLLKLQGGSLDREYLDRWSHELGVADLLAKALKRD